MNRVIMCEVKSMGKMAKNQKEKKLQWSTTKKMDYDEPHLVPNEKM